MEGKGLPGCGGKGGNAVIPILDHKHPDQPSVFDPANLLREARRQKAAPLGNVPEICVAER